MYSNNSNSNNYYYKLNLLFPLIRFKLRQCMMMRRKGSSFLKQEKQNNGSLNRNYYENLSSSSSSHEICNNAEIIGNFNNEYYRKAKAVIMNFDESSITVLYVLCRLSKEMTKIVEIISDDSNAENINNYYASNTKLFQSTETTNMKFNNKHIKELIINNQGKKDETEIRETVAVLPHLLSFDRSEVHNEDNNKNEKKVKVSELDEVQYYNDKSEIYSISVNHEKSSNNYMDYENNDDSLFGMNKNKSFILFSELNKNKICKNKFVDKNKNYLNKENLPSLLQLNFTENNKSEIFTDVAKNKKKETKIEICEKKKHSIENLFSLIPLNKKHFSTNPKCQSLSPLKRKHKKMQFEEEVCNNRLENKLESKIRNNKVIQNQTLNNNRIYDNENDVLIDAAVTSEIKRSLLLCIQGIESNLIKLNEEFKCREFNSENQIITIMKINEDLPFETNYEYLQQLLEHSFEHPLRHSFEHPLLGDPDILISSKLNQMPFLSFINCFIK